MRLELTILVVLAVYSAAAPVMGGEKTIKPDYKVIKYTFTRDNDTDVMDQEPPNLQLIPLDFLCEFCQVVILKLKERQATEQDFEEKIRAECLNSTENDSSSLCDVINRVNLDRLKNDDPKDICDSQGMCVGSGNSGNSKKEETGPPGMTPDQKLGGGGGGDVQKTPEVKNSESHDAKDSEIEKHLTIDEKNVNTTLNVEDIAPYN
ncbi:hypothetical protein CRE_17477 [Caenorhabditis remanei]|uniref:Saposin B-type domain-containing protein n=1 Tax=Caenorhabditis remanei TaxID=31234 RepID=E3N295_CAERE|nr:hypothetical protein CRE_17477 [Caenorhabditis remanei]